MHQNPDGDGPHGMEGTEEVERRCGVEAEDGFAFVQDYEGLSTKNDDKQLKALFFFYTSEVFCSRR